MITLTSPLTFAVGGVIQETADHSAAASASVAWLTPQHGGIMNSISSQLSYGDLEGSPSVFTPSARADPLFINVDLTTGNWSCPNTGQTGTLSAAQLTTIQNALKNLRNTLETFAVTSGIMPGTQTPW